MNTSSSPARSSSEQPRLQGSARTLAVHEVHQAALRVARRNGDPAIREQAEDIAQDVSLAFTRGGHWLDVERPAAWATRAAQLRILNVRRDRERADAMDPDDTALLNVIDLDPNMSPSLVVGARMHAAQLLEALTPRERELLRLVAEGYSHAEIAERMGYRGPRSVTTLLNRVRAKVLAAIGGSAHVHEWVGITSGPLCSDGPVPA